MSEAKDLTEIRQQIQQRSAEQKLTRVVPCLCLKCESC